MRNKIVLFVLVALSVTTTVSCKKKNDDSKKPGKAQLSLVIDGKEWTPDLAFSQIHASADLLMISGHNMTGDEIIVITFPANQTGSFLMSDEEAIADLLYIDASGESFGSSFAGTPSGRIVVTSFDTDKQTVSGTFEGIVYNFFGDKNKVITKGVFNNVTPMALGLTTGK
jgi:hypothetical protein